jgi:hypothetical protein
MNRFCVVGACVVLASVVGVAQADEYGAWVKDTKKQCYTCDYTYKTKDGGMSKQSVVVYYADKDRSGWAYYYNAKQEPWARCAVPGNPKYNPKAMTWEKLAPDGKGYAPFQDTNGKPQPDGYCPAPKDGKAAIPVLSLPLPPK